MRRRLTYGNVIATIALFFALSGGSAMAVGKYLVGTDVIASGDLAGSTYQSPVIAAGTITSSMFATTATAPDASKFGGRAPTGYAMVVARGETEPSGLLNPGQSARYELVVPGIDKTTDYVVVNSSNDGTLTINASIFTLGSSGDRLAIFVHNGSTLPSSVGTLRYMVLR